VDQSQDRLPNDTICLSFNREERLRTKVTENSKTLDIYSVCKQIN